MDSLDIIKLIEKNPLTRLSKEYNSKFIVKIKDNFTESQQQLFVASFYCYLNYDSKNDFVIDLDDVWKWIGFTRRDNCKRVLEKNFIQDIDYKILLLRKEEQVHGGHNKEEILLNIDTFRELCTLVGTDRGKEIRKYYIKLEKIFHELMNEETDELRKQLDQKTKENSNLQLSLKAERTNFARAANKGTIKDTPEKCVYICQGAEGYKVGETANSYNRECALKTGGALNKIVYTKKCHDRKLVEKLVHHILNNFRTSNTHEWFTSSFEVTKCALDSAYLFADGLLNKGQEMFENDFYNKLKDLIDSLSPKEETLIDNSTPEESEVEEEKQVKYCEIDNTIKNPLNFDQFIEECCIKDDDATSFSVDIFGAHRLWSRCNEKATHDAFYQYLSSNFKNVKVYDPVTNAKLSSYKGFSLKPITYIQDDPPSDIDDFIESKCKLSYNARFPAKELYDAFEKFKKEKDNDFVITSDERKRIDSSISQKFLCSKVYNGKSSVLGYFGLCLKDDNNFIGLKLAPKLKKRVIKVDINTNEIIATFESLTEAAKERGKGAAYLSQDIRFKKPYGNFIYKYI